MFRRRRLLLLFLAAAPLLLSADKCNHVAYIDVKVATRVFEDGPIERTVSIAERQSGQESVPLSDWGITVPAHERWRRVEASGTTLVAEGSFARAEDVPALVDHTLEDGSTRADRHRLEVEVGDLVVARLFQFRETESDPFGPDEVAAAYDKALEQLLPAAQGALRARLGDSIGTSRMESFLRGPLKGAVVETVSSYENILQADDLPSRARSIFAKHGLTIPAAPRKDDGSDDGEEWAKGLRDWIAGRLAESLTTPQRTVSPEDTDFLFDGDAYEPGGEMGRRLPPPAEGKASWEQVLTPFVDASSGFYASHHDSIASGKLLFLFQPRLELPGRILTTNGTVDGREIVWVFGDREVTRQGRVMEARSAVVLPEPLRRLGVPPDIELVRLLRIVALLTTEEGAEGTRQRLAEAVADRKPALIYERKSPDTKEPTLGETHLFELGRLLGIPLPRPKTSDPRSSP